VRLSVIVRFAAIAAPLVAPNIAHAGPVATPAGVAMPTNARLVVRNVLITQTDPMVVISVVPDTPEKLWAGKDTWVRVDLEETPFEASARFRRTTCRVDRFSGSPPQLFPVTVVTAEIRNAGSRGPATSDRHLFAADCHLPGRAFATPGAYQINVVGGLAALPNQSFYGGSRVFAGGIVPTPTPKKF
jgi:hypothetical protein